MVLPSAPFPTLTPGQTRVDAVLRDALWYDRDGHQHGRGDLDFADLRSIMAELRPEAVFVVIVTQRGGGAIVFSPFIGTHEGTSRLHAEDLARYATLAVTRDALYAVKDGGGVDAPFLRAASGCAVHEVSRAQIRALLALGKIILY